MKQSQLSRFLSIEKKKLIRVVSKSIFWFFVGIFLGLFLVTSFTFIIFEKRYENLVYPGVTIAGINFGGETQQEVKSYFDRKNSQIDAPITFKQDGSEIQSSTKGLEIGYDSALLAKQAYGIGRSSDIVSNVSIITQAYINSVNLSSSFRYSDEKLDSLLSPINQKITIEPTDALFTFENGKVTTFQPSNDGQTLDLAKVKNQIKQTTPTLFTAKTKEVIINLPIKILKPKITTDKVNNLGIKELIGSGTSLFQHSIESRIYNVTLAASRVNGILIAPGEVFSFDKALGDVSSFTGYKQAYVIENGKTVLGDGGGVCQVSTTLFRAILNAGLPVIERHAHAYRVGYYEEDSPPGIDATVYVPSVDLKFKNDTANYILIQSVIDPTTLRLTYNLYGTKDGRNVSITTPVVTNIIPAPPDKFQDDPTLPKGTVQQTDFSANGATATFSRTVTKDGKTLISETYTSIYQPWQAVFLRGTQ